MEANPTFRPKQRLESEKPGADGTFAAHCRTLVPSNARWNRMPLDQRTSLVAAGLFVAGKPGMTHIFDAANGNAVARCRCSQGRLDVSYSELCSEGYFYSRFRHVLFALS